MIYYSNPERVTRDGKVSQLPGHYLSLNIISDLE